VRIAVVALDVKAIWSAPPPVPAGTINSTVFVGFHCAEAPTVIASTAAAATAPQDAIRIKSFFIAFLSRDRFPLFFRVERGADFVEKAAGRAPTASGQYIGCHQEGNLPDALIITH
jgi:hypothetical protein